MYAGDLHKEMTTMGYTTQGYMTAADLADHQQLTDIAADPNCPGHPAPEAYEGAIGYCTVAMDCPGEQNRSGQGKPMSTAKRQAIYARRGRNLTARQRRRLVKRAGRDPEAVVTRDDGMGYSLAMQGYREILPLPVPVSGAPV